MRVINLGQALDFPAKFAGQDNSDEALLAANPGMDIKRYRQGFVSRRRLVASPIIQLLPDAGFDDPVAWGSPTGPWTITESQAVWDATVATPLVPATAVPLTAGQAYRITYELASPDAWIHLAGEDGTNLTGWTELIGAQEHSFEFTPLAAHPNIKIVPSSGNGAYTLSSVGLVKV